MQAQSFAEDRIPLEAFHFSGQASLDPWTLKDLFASHGWSRYEGFLAQEPELCMERIRQLVRDFPTWQRQNRNGRPAMDHRTLLIGAMLRQVFRAPFRSTHSLLNLFQDFFGLELVPKKSTLSHHNRSRRFLKLLKRFHRWILEQLPNRSSTIATDATGFSTAKKVWNGTDYGLRVQPNWTKAHIAVEVPQLLILNHEATPGRVHDSQMFESVWKHLPRNVRPVRSVADAAYASETCLNAARLHGATPIHGIKHNARHRAVPRTDYEKLVNFATHWPNRFHALKRQRGLIETVFSATKNRFGDRIRSRSKVGRECDLQARFTAQNMRTLALRDCITKN